MIFEGGRGKTAIWLCRYIKRKRISVWWRRAPLLLFSFFESDREILFNKNSKFLITSINHRRGGVLHYVYPSALLSVATAPSSPAHKLARSCHIQILKFKRGFCGFLQEQTRLRTSSKPQSSMPFEISGGGGVELAFQLIFSSPLPVPTKLIPSKAPRHNLSFSISEWRLFKLYPESC